MSRSLKAKPSFCCTECGYTNPKWMGCCPECKNWNCMIEEKPVSSYSSGTSFSPSYAAAPLAFEKLPLVDHPRYISGIEEWDRVVGGGIVPGSFFILTGDPGIGKSTLLLQVAHHLAESCSVIYFSSEESLHQIRGRAERLSLSHTKLLFSDESRLEEIIHHAKQSKAACIIIDSLQHSILASRPEAMPGTIAQLREASFMLMRFAKEEGIAVLVTGHITKEGQIAGPKLLEHVVDAVFYLQGEDRWHTRVLRSVKNRFGPVNEIGFFEMEEKGLIQVQDINSHIISLTEPHPGSVLVCSMEGSRPLLLELQALCLQSKFGVPQRVITGIDPKWVVLMAAIIEKHLHIPLSGYDIFFKVTGGCKLKESGIDLGIVLALLSSYFQLPLPEKSMVMGEVHVTGALGVVTHMTSRMKEGEKFGISHVIGPMHSSLSQENLKLKKILFKNVCHLASLFPVAAPVKKQFPFNRGEST